MAAPGRKKFPNRVVATAWEVIAELDPRLALGPQVDQLLALFDTAERLTGDQSRHLTAACDAAWYAARYAARYAAWCAARGVARTAAMEAAEGAAWYAAWRASRHAAWDAAWDAAGAAAWYAAWDAAGALVVRDLISTDHFDVLTAPMRAAGIDFNSLREADRD